jgi:hypothetical protein
VYTIGYDFGDTFLKLDALEFAVRLATFENVYAPDPARLQVQESGECISLRAQGLVSGGGQASAEGSLELEITRGADRRYIVRARGSHGSEIAKSVVILVRGIAVRDLMFRPNDRVALEDTPWGSGWIKARRYPYLGASMPLAFVDDVQGREWFALSKDNQVRAKYFGAFFDYVSNRQIFVLSHEADARSKAHDIEMPEWHIGEGRARADVVMERCRDLETHFGLVPYAQRRDVPAWVNDIQLVANFHGAHWTGHIFNTFDRMRDGLDWLTQRIEGKHVMAFLPAWDGRYYYAYPRYEPYAPMGGGEGLKRLVEHAHALGVRVVPMFGANGGNKALVEQLGLQEAVMQDAWGKEYRLDWVDWDYDLAAEKNSYLLNLGEPKYRAYMVERASRMVDEFGVDGIFLDITFAWENDSRYSPYEGTVAWVQEMRAKYPDLLLFGENSYDALWGVMPLWAEDRGPTGHAAALYRYCRQTYYLAHPSPGTGSGGVHEGAWHYEGWKWNVPEMSIPALSVVEDTFTTRAAETEAVIENARKWKFRAPPIAEMP